MTRTWDLSNSDRLKLLSIVELRDLLQDEDKIHQIIISSPKFQALQQQKQMMLASNYRLAEVNLSLQPHLSRGKLRLVKMYLELGRICGEIGRKQNKLVAHQMKVQPHTVQALLGKKLGQAMDQSDNLLQRFLDQRVSAERFVDSYQVLSKLYHICAVKLEKCKELTNPTRNQEVRPSLHCCCARPQSEIHSIYHCLGPSVTSANCSCHPHSRYLVKTPYLPPLDYHCCHHSQWKPVPRPDSRCPEGEKMYGKASRRPARPVYLPRLHQQPRGDQRDPKC